MNRVKNFLRDESGAGAGEYCLLLAIIIMTVLLGMRSLGTEMNTMFVNAGIKYPESGVP